MPSQARGLPGVAALRIGVLGGTGPQGRGLAYRLARGGLQVIIGSRDLSRATAAAKTVACMDGAGLGTVVPGSNQYAARADMIITAIPYSVGRAQTLSTLRGLLAGRIVIDCTNPIRYGPAGPELLEIPAGSAAQETALLLPESTVVAAFHHVAAPMLVQPVDRLYTDVLIASDDPAASQAVLVLTDRAGMRGVGVGRLSHTRFLEVLAKDLISLNYKAARSAR